MNQEQQLANKLISLIQAVADDKNLQMERERFQGNSPDFREWCDVDLDYLLHRFNREGLRFDCIRIKPKPKNKSYRIALIKDTMGNFAACAVQHEAEEEIFKRTIGFICWLTDRIEYELPEGE